MSRPFGAFLILGALAISLVFPLAAMAQDTASPIADELDPAAFSPIVTNPFVPLASIRTRIYEGSFPDDETGKVVLERVEERVLAETVTIAGIEATVIEVSEYADGVLTERTLDYYAQHDDGSVYYLGEDVDIYEDGQLAGHEGAWRAGEGENQPGLFMPGNLEVGQQFDQERAPGVAEDRSTVIALDTSVSIAAGSFAGCLRTEDVNPLEGDTEVKTYCPGVGLVREENDEGSLDLIYFEGGADTAD